MWGVPATQLDPGSATPVSIGTSGQNVDACANKKRFDRMVYVGMVASSATPLTVDRVNARIEGPINQVRKEVVEVPAASRRSHEISSSFRRV